MATAPAGMQSSAPKILVVDDSHITLEWLRIILNRAGFAVVQQAMPVGVGAAIVREQPALVLLDMSMPTLTGEEVVNLVRRNVATQNTRIIFYSASSELELEAAVSRCGADGYATKSMGETQLIEKLRVYLSGAKPPKTFAQLSTAAPRPAAAATPISTPRPVSASTAPLASGTRPATKTDTSVPAGVRTSGLLPRPLFVDDDPRVLEGYRRVFGAHMNARYVANVDEARAVLDSQDPPDVVVCDVVMGESNGVDFYQDIVKRSPQWRDRFVFVTGSTYGASSSRLNDVPSPVLNKPVSAQILSNIIRSLR